MFKRSFFNVTNFKYKHWPGKPSTLEFDQAEIDGAVSDNYSELHFLEPFTPEEILKLASCGGSLNVITKKSYAVPVYIQKEKYWRKQQKQWDEERRKEKEYHWISQQRKHILYLLKRLNNVCYGQSEHMTAANAYQELVTKLREKQVVSIYIKGD